MRLQQEAEHWSNQQRSEATARSQEVQQQAEHHSSQVSSQLMQWGDQAALPQVRESQKQLANLQEQATIE